MELVIFICGMIYLLILKLTSPPKPKSYYQILQDKKMKEKTKEENTKQDQEARRIVECSIIDADQEKTDGNKSN